MEEVECTCLKCKAQLGTFKNAWNGIGSTYFSPVFPSVTYVSGFEVVGDVYTPSIGSPVENCGLQDLTCKGCGTVLGMRCESAPEGHMLKKHQIILRLAFMSVISTSTHEKPVINIQGKLALIAPGVKKASTPVPTPSKALSFPVQFTPRSQIRSLSFGETRSVVSTPRSQIHSFMPAESTLNGSWLPSVAQEQTLKNMEKFRSWTKSMIESQRKDIERISDTVDRVEKGMKSFRDFMAEMRTEMAISRQEMLTDEDVSDVRNEVKLFRKEILAERQVQDAQITQDVATLRSEFTELHHQVESERSVPQLALHDFGTSEPSLQAPDIISLRLELEALKNRLDSLTATQSCEKLETTEGEVNELPASVPTVPSPICQQPFAQGLTPPTSQSDGSDIIRTDHTLDKDNTIECYVDESALKDSENARLDGEFRTAVDFENNEPTALKRKHQESLELEVASEQEQIGKRRRGRSSKATVKQPVIRGPNRFRLTEQRRSRSLQVVIPQPSALESTPPTS